MIPLHEAGHGVAAIRTGHRFEALVVRRDEGGIVPRSSSTLTPDSLVEALGALEDPGERHRDAAPHIVVALAGPAAEATWLELPLAERPADGCQADYRMARRLCAVLDPDDADAELARWWAFVRREFNDARVWRATCRVAVALTAHRVLGEAEVRAIAAPILGPALVGTLFADAEPVLRVETAV